VLAEFIGGGYYLLGLADITSSAEMWCLPDPDFLHDRPWGLPAALV